MFDENYKILEARLIPHEIVGRYSKYRAHVNAHILHLKGAILNDPAVVDITDKIRDI